MSFFGLAADRVTVVSAELADTAGNSAVNLRHPFILGGAEEGQSSMAFARADLLPGAGVGRKNLIHEPAGLKS